MVNLSRIEYIKQMVAESKKAWLDFETKHKELLIKYEKLVQEAADLRINNVEIFQEIDCLYNMYKTWQSLDK